MKTENRQPRPRVVGTLGGACKLSAVTWRPRRDAAKKCYTNIHKAGTDHAYYELEAIAVKVNRQAIYDKSGERAGSRETQSFFHRKQRPLQCRSAIAAGNSYHAQLFEMASFRGEWPIV